MVAVALPDIREEFSLSHGAVAWLVSGYLIAMAVAQPIGGRLGDQIGRERVYRTGLLAFLVLALVTPFSPNFAVLVALRVAQATAGAVLMPNGMAMLRTNAPPGQLGQLNGINGAVLSFAAAVGPLVGAAVLAVGSWRWLFPISVPFILLALVLLPRLHAALRSASPRTADRTGLGAALFFARACGDHGAARRAARRRRARRRLALRWAATGAIAALFVWRQFGARLSPAAEWRLFRMPSFAAATAYTLLTNLSMYTTLLMIPFFVREVLGKGTELSGLLLGAMSVLRRDHGAIRRAPVGRVGAAAVGAVGGGADAGRGDRAARGPERDGVAAVPGGVPGGAGARAGAGRGRGEHGGDRVGAAGAGGIGASGTSSMMRYVGSIVGAGILAGVLSSDSAGGEVATFRIVMLAVGHDGGAGGRGVDVHPPLRRR